MVNIKTVAKKANVSTSTVSRVLNGTAKISDETRKRVLTAVKELGYHPNSIAKSLRSQKAGTIITVLNDIRNPVFAGMIKGMEDAAYKSGYSLLIGNTDNSLAREARYLNDLFSKKADGLILITPRVEAEAIAALSGIIPVVLINDPRRLPDIPVVGIDDYAAVYELTEHMIHAGHKRFAFVGGDEKAGIAVKRKQAFGDCMARHGIAHAPILSTGVTMQHGRGALDTLLDSVNPELPLAVMCYNDEIAVGLMQRARERGLSIPEQLAVCGFDDISTASIVYPALTTVHQPTYQIGEIAANLLIDLLQDKTPAVQTIYLPHSICVREST